jgi:hypothetical protein
MRRFFTFVAVCTASTAGMMVLAAALAGSNTAFGDENPIELATCPNTCCSGAVCPPSVPPATGCPNDCNNYYCSSAMCLER